MPQAIPMVASMVVGYVASKAATALGAPPVVSAIVGMAAGGYVGGAMSSAASVGPVQSAASKAASDASTIAPTADAYNAASAAQNTSLANAATDAATQSWSAGLNQAPDISGAVETAGQMGQTGANVAPTTTMQSTLDNIPNYAEQNTGGLLDGFTNSVSDGVNNIGDTLSTGWDKATKALGFGADGKPMSTGKAIVLSSGLNAASGAAAYKAKEASIQKERDRIIGRQQTMLQNSPSHQAALRRQQAQAMGGTAPTTVAMQVGQNPVTLKNSVMGQNRFAKMGLLGGTA